MSSFFMWILRIKLGSYACVANPNGAVSPGQLRVSDWGSVSERKENQQWRAHLPRFREACQQASWAVLGVSHGF